MCGRYRFTDVTWKEVERDFPDMIGRIPLVPAGDVLPSMQAPALTWPAFSMEMQQPGKDLAASLLTWGFPGFDGKGLIINARAEGIEEKPSFAESFRERRCVLPAAGFYEWDRKKQKADFTLPGSPVIYLAGIFRPFGEEKRFVIITREANGSVLPIHDRMPLMIRPEDVRAWIGDESAAKTLLTDPLPDLAARMEYEQMSLF